MKEHSGYEDLHDSNSWSIISNVRGRMEVRRRMEVCCLSVGFVLVILTIAWPLIAKSHSKYNVTQDMTSGPGVVGFLRTRALPVWCSK
jgi:hypothetical protein